MKAFIIRPFGTQEGIDFDKVEKELIIPALGKIGINAGTTAEILESGNIRQDMFHLLLTSDIVIADISIHNANVFYELGVRHAFRDKITFLIRTRKHDVPFDLKTDRYLAYNYPEVAGQVDLLSKALEASLNATQQDSPIFLMLPRLNPQDPEFFLSIPQGFGEEVEIARSMGDSGKLALLAQEATKFPWQLPALRAIGEVQFELHNLNHAMETWENIKRIRNKDPEADDRLSTIYQRLAQKQMNNKPAIAKEYFSRSNQAIDRLLKHSTGMSPQKLAEVYSLRARNAKTEWINCWKDLEEKKEKEKSALTSKYLVTAYKYYLTGFKEDLNHFYSGLNALALLTVIKRLGKRYPETWELLFDDEEEARQRLAYYVKEHSELSKLVRYSLRTSEEKLKKTGSSNVWVEFTKADLACLLDSRPEKVQVLYQRACQGASLLPRKAAKRQLLIYRDLGILKENVKAGLAVMEDVMEKAEEQTEHFILFTGHMIDSEDRARERFPGRIEKEVKEAILKAVTEEKNRLNLPIIGIAGGASGGDILFHESCRELNIKSELMLALPRDKFVDKSVSAAGPSWINRFDRLYEELNVRVLSKEAELPTWLKTKNGTYNIWERNNLWMLFTALAAGGANMTLIALWDGEKGDNAGGTEHMVKVAQEKGANIIPIDPLHFLK